MFRNILAIFVGFQTTLIFGLPLINQINPYPRQQFLPPGPQINDSKIVGGEDTTIEVYPHQVSLLFFNQHVCGGSLISSRWVLSAAHCTQIYRPNSSIFKYSIRLGSSFRNLGGTIMTVSRIVDHPLYGTGASYDHDITLIQMSREVRIDNTIRPISLPVLGQINPRPGSTATVTGWGALYSAGPAADVLQKVILPIVSKSTCQNLYDDLPFVEPPQITDRMICAGFMTGGYDSCQGDSGGPMIINNQLIGVVSWGYSCAAPNAPGVYSSVPNVRQWIKNVANI